MILTKASQKDREEADVAAWLLNEDLTPIPGTVVGFRLKDAGRIHLERLDIEDREIPDFISAVYGVSFHYGISVRYPPHRPKTKKQFYHMAYWACGSRKWFAENVINDVRQAFPEEKNISYGDIWEYFLAHCCMKVLYMMAKTRKETGGMTGWIAGISAECAAGTSAIKIVTMNA